MEIYVLISLGIFIGFFFHLFLSKLQISGLVNRNLECKGATDKSMDLRELFVGRNVDRRDKPARVYIPNPFAKWPWPRRMNPHYAMVKKEADEWIMSFKAFSPKAQDAYNCCNFGKHILSHLFACLAYPTARKEHLRAACDLMHLIWTFDEYSDRSTSSQVRVQKDAIMDALQNPHKPRPKGEWIGGEIARQFWERTIQNASKGSQKRLILAMDEYLEEVVQEIIDKEHRRILDVQTYIQARRRTGAVKTTFALVEFDLDIPDEIMEHPTIQEIILTSLDLIILQNDLLSYNLERLRGDELHNIITCVMHEYKTDVNGAMLWIQDFMLETREKFHTAFAAVPEWEEPLNSQVKAYCDGIGQWVGANDDWSFESERYFGKKGPEIKNTRWVSLLPQKTTSEIGPVHIDDRLL